MIRLQKQRRGIRKGFVFRKPLRIRVAMCGEMIGRSLHRSHTAWPLPRAQCLQQENRLCSCNIVEPVLGRTGIVSAVRPTEAYQITGRTPGASARKEKDTPHVQGASSLRSV